MVTTAEVVFVGSTASRKRTSSKAGSTPTLITICSRRVHIGASRLATPHNFDRSMTVHTLLDVHFPASNKYPTIEPAPFNTSFPRTSTISELRLTATSIAPVSSSFESNPT